MSEQIEGILRNPSVLKTAEGDCYTDEAPALWAWFAHGYDTGMEPFYSIDQLRAAVRSARDSEVERLREALDSILEITNEEHFIRSADSRLYEIRTYARLALSSPDKESA